MRAILKILLAIVLFFVLTMLTQVGGVVYLLSLLAHPFINKKVLSTPYRFAVKLIVFLGLYIVVSIGFVPLAADPLGRVPLPMLNGNLRPANFLTCVLNRHYVKHALLRAANATASEMNEKYPGVRLNYLDANFPFIDGFPLLPHLSHNDGKKLDLSFQYDGTGAQPTNRVPSFIGYGVCVEPMAQEENMPKKCDSKGYWQYSFLRKIVSQENKEEFKFNEGRTADMINSFVKNKTVGKIFIEPHLKTRLKLNNAKIRFHGCQAVRHDDHIHVQLR